MNEVRGVVRDKIMGCLLGGAIGDACGGAHEGQAPPVAITEADEWRLSDDTQLTLATCEAIIENNGAVDPAAIAARLAAWHRAGHVTGVGASTHKALTELAAGGHWALVGRRGERAAGNGAAMRIAPLAFCLNPDEPHDRRTIRDVSRITHHHEEAYAGALAVVIAVRAAAFGAWDGAVNLPRLVAEQLPDTQVRDRLLLLAELNEAISLREIAARYGASGYAVESVPLALCGAQRVRHSGFAMMLTQLIACGGDTDTNAAIAGQVAGAWLGYQQLPPAWLARLPERALIESIAGDLARSATPYD